MASSATSAPGRASCIGERLRQALGIAAGDKITDHAPIG